MTDESKKYDTTEEVTSLWDDYERGRSYHSSTGLSRNLPRFVKFYEGDQWPAPTKNTKNLPRPVINIIKMICRAKKSAILSVPVKLIYRADDESVNVDKFNNFSEYIQKEYGQEALDKRAIDDAVKKGTYVYHYYWDTEAEGKNGIKEGGLRCEIIDPLSIFFADPTEIDEQKQEWILIASRENVRSVRAKCDKDVDEESITSDEADSKYGTVELEGDKLCTVLTRYFRRDGEVWCEKATKSVIINKAFPITPDLERAGRELGINAPNNSLPDNHEGEDLMPKGVRAHLYPVVVGNYEPREGSIYGLSEVEGLIPNQKAINFNVAMALLNNQALAWGKYIVMPNALKGQTINNEPGQVLVDYSGTGNGIKKMSEQVIQGQPLQIVEMLTQLTRAVTGSTEVMTGETLGASMSGAAIAQLQSQAQQPVEELRDSFWLVKEKQGKILAQFFKLYYTDKEFSYKAKDAKKSRPFNMGGGPGDPMMAKTSSVEAEEVLMTEVFDSAEFENVEFSIVVEATAGTNASTAGDISALDVLVAKGAISVKTYIKSYPKDALSNRTELLRAIEEEEAQELAQLKKQNEELQLQLAQAEQEKEALNKIINEQQAVVDNVLSVIEENSNLKLYIANLYIEASSKIREANRQTQMANAKASEATTDASDMARVIYENGLYDGAPVEPIRMGGMKNGLPRV